MDGDELVANNLSEITIMCRDFVMEPPGLQA
jgi:hypothetical protein